MVPRVFNFYQTVLLHAMKLITIEQTSKETESDKIRSISFLAARNKKKNVPPANIN